MATFEGVLFDFGHTLFDTIPAESTCGQFRQASGCTVDEAAVADAWAGIRQRSRQPEELAKGRDLTAEGHRRCWLDLLAPLDKVAPGLADFAYSLESSPAGWRPYPDTHEVLRRLRSLSFPIGVVSDCGWDIRGVFAAHGLEGMIDSFDLSYEHGVCKPDARIFAAACEHLGTSPSSTLMVGDSWLTDGGAAAVGLTTLILPARDRTESPALSSVLKLVA